MIDHKFLGSDRSLEIVILRLLVIVGWYCIDVHIFLCTMCRYAAYIHGYICVFTIPSADGLDDQQQHWEVVKKCVGCCRVAVLILADVSEFC